MTDTPRAPEVLRVHGPGDLVEAIPYLLGFHPRESLVVVGMCGTRVEITARVDLDELDDAAVLAETMRVLGRTDADRVVAVVYQEIASEISGEIASELAGELADGRGLPRAALIGDVASRCAEHGVDLVDAVLVNRGRWWSYLCRDACCPVEGSPLPGDGSPVAAKATYVGLVALPDRDDLAAELRPDDDAYRARLEPAIAEHENLVAAAVVGGYDERRRRSVKRAIFAAARDADSALFVGGSGVLTDDDVCRFAVALSDTSIRDAIWMAVDQGRLDGRPLWRQIARRVPPPYDAAPLFLFGWASWREGNGASAAIAAERALASDPGYTGADLLRGALVHGLDPRRTPRLRMPRSA